MTDLRIVGQGPGWIGLDWSAPPKGVGTGNGGVRYYKVQWRPSDDQDWELIGAKMKTQVVLKDQEPGIEWQYRVTAVNREGEATASNVVCRKVARRRWRGAEVVEDVPEERRFETA